MGTLRKEGELNLNDLYKVYLKRGGLASYKEYKLVVETFMKEATNQIIKTGWIFSMPHYCGQLSVVQLERKFTVTDKGTIKGKIDFGASNKLKQEIIDRGELPLVNYKDNEGNIIGNNGGINWLCYQIDPTYFSWVWSTHINLKHGLDYKLYITKDNSLKLSKSITENSYLIFKLRQRNGTNKDYLRKILTARSAVEIQTK